MGVNPPNQIIDKTMPNEPLETETPKNEEEVATPEVATEEVAAESQDSDKDLQSALSQKAHFREKFEKAEEERKALEEELSELQRKAVKPKEEAKASSPLAVEDYIDISTSLDGLDEREKAYLAEQHKLSGKSLKEIRDSEDFQLWDSAYKSKLEAERAVAPNTTQEIEDEPKTLTAALRGATLAEKEEMLKEAGLYKERKIRPDRTDIGDKRTG